MRSPSAVRARRTLGIAVTLLTAVSASSCSLQREGHEWIRQRPHEAFNLKWEALPAERVREVPPELRQDAIALLNTEIWRLLSEEEFRRFVPGGVANLGGRWYLLRAVRSPENGGTFHVLTHGRDVAVTYRTPSRRHETIKSAVAAHLDESPAGIFTEISADR